MTRADALRTLFLAPLGALFGRVLGKKPEPTIRIEQTLILNDGTRVHPNAWEGTADDLMVTTPSRVYGRVSIDGLEVPPIESWYHHPRYPGYPIPVVRKLAP